MARPRLSDPTGARARMRVQNQLRFANQLLAGERIAAWSNHHTGMRLLKSLLTDGRPETCACGDEQVTLSLANHAGPDTYVGYRVGKDGGRTEYLLSTNPEDYVWECHACNHLRDVAWREGRAA